jgi:hypothetical protein
VFKHRPKHYMRRFPIDLRETCNTLQSTGLYTKYAVCHLGGPCAMYLFLCFSKVLGVRRFPQVPQNPPWASCWFPGASPVNHQPVYWAPFGPGHGPYLWPTPCLVNYCDRKRAHIRVRRSMSGNRTKVPVTVMGPKID